MRKTLKDLFDKAIVYRYSLPYKTIIEKTSITTKHDYCFEGNNDSEIADVIYNGIVDFAYGETRVDLTNLDAQQRRAINTRIRYNESDDISLKIKYGFFGEVVLNLILESLFKSSVLVAKGYFYDRTSKREAHGYDAFQSYYNRKNDSLCLVIGEAKFHSSFNSAVDSVVKNLEKATNEAYFNDNLLAIMSFIEKGNADIVPEEILNIYYKWYSNADINLYQEINANKIKVFYPILIMANKEQANYDDTIKKIVEIVNRFVDKYKPRIGIDVTILFIMLPVENAVEIKKEVLEWILESKPVV